MHGSEVHQLVSSLIWAFHEKVLNNFEVSVAQRAEVLIGPFSLLQAVSRPDTILQHQTDEELDDWVSFIVLNYK
jgi:hypothetical protein